MQLIERPRSRTFLNSVNISEDGSTFNCLVENLLEGIEFLLKYYISLFGVFVHRLQEERSY